MSAANLYDTCHEAVIRGGYDEPCERPTVGWRSDVTEGHIYPVCRRHWRAPPVPLTDLIARRPDLGACATAGAVIAVGRVMGA